MSGADLPSLPGGAREPSAELPPPEGALARVAAACTAWAERWIPDAFVFALLAMALVIVAALATGASLGDVVSAWGSGFWELSRFTLQMSLIIITGYVVATARPVYRLIAGLAALPRTPRWSPLALSLALTACNAHSFERALMLTAYRPGAPLQVAPPYRILAGDMHCHVSPPDGPDDVSRDLAGTAALAREEGLDFVVLTPHLPARFFLDPEQRARAAAGHAELRRAIASLAPSSTIFVPGFEYTDGRFGHVGASFADLGKILGEVPLDVARKDPGRFFEQWVLDGGLLVVNHPMVTPLASVLPPARADLSWRPWTKGPPYPPEIEVIHGLAVGFEAYNAAVAHMRDGFLLGDRDIGVREVLARLDAEIAVKRRRIAPVGGSDSHTGYLRAAVFVLAEERTEAGVRDALVQGRTCVESPEACTLEVRAPGGRWVPVGGALRAGTEVEARASAGVGELFKDGVRVAGIAAGAVVRVAVAEDRCSLVRAHVGAGWSAPVYVNCGCRVVVAGRQPGDDASADSPARPRPEGPRENTHCDFAAP
jgi:hypothetical protein